jgi:GT2 family glycosyltransferase
MARVAIVIVTHQSGDFVGSCLDSVAGLPDTEIVVVDNNSTDSTRAEVTARGVRLIANPFNAGFAGGVNQGVRATSAPLILLLNPDARLETGIEPLIACFSDPKTGGAGGLLTGPDGAPQAGFMSRTLPSAAALAFECLAINSLWPGNPVNWHYRCLGNDPMIPALVEQPAGALFMFSRPVWEQLSGFDERFWPVWFEDTDFCARLHSAGFVTRYEPATRASHTGGHSVAVFSLDIRENCWYGSLLKYAAKHFSPVAFGLVCLSVICGAAGRAVAASPKRGVKVFEVYSSVIRLASAHLRGALNEGSGAGGSRRDK